MTNTSLRAVRATALAIALIWGGGFAVPQAWAQAADPPPPGFLDQLLGRDRGTREEPPQRLAQVSATDLVMRIDRLEAQIRQLTGALEQMQFRNQQLEQQLRRMQEDTEFRLQEMGSKSGSRPPATQQVRPVAPPPAPPPPGMPGRRSDVAAEPPAAPAAPVASARRSDVFDPTQNPNAPGAPRPLGTLPSGPGPIMAEPDERPSAPVETEVGAPGGRVAGAPLDLSTLSGAVANDPSLSPPASAPPPAAGGMLPPPPPRNPNATGAQTASVQPPSQSPRDTYDLAYGYVLRKDYALAEEAFREFLRRYPSDRLVPDAHYWLGESNFQRQRYRDAANSFLDVTTKYETSSKAPDALLRLGQSLAAMGEKEMACASLAEVMRKYPRASLSVKQGVEREQKRARC
jgi:tol-pal system protein YbgF